MSDSNMDKDCYYDLDNFDEDGAEYKSRLNQDKKSKSSVDDYGDGFDSQTGENKNVQYETDDYDYNDNYNDASITKSKSAYNNLSKGKNKKAPKKKKGTLKISIVLAVLAGICLVAALILAFSRCGSGSKPRTDATVSSSSIRVTTAPVTERITDGQIYTESQITEPIHTEPEQTEPINTEAELTRPRQTEPVYTEPLQTEPEQTEPVVYTEPVNTEAENIQSEQEDSQTDGGIAQNEE